MSDPFEDFIIDTLADRGPTKAGTLEELASREIQRAKWKLLDSGRIAADADLRLVLTLAALDDGPTNGGGS